MSASFSFSKYSGIAANATWTLGWLTVACLAGARQFTNQNNPSDVINMSAASGDGGVIANLIVAIACTVFGSFITFRSMSRNQVTVADKESVPEPWFRRITGWLGVVVWCGAAVVWNLSTLSCLIKAAREGQFVLMLIMVPFSLVGFFLLLMLFVSIGIALDSLFCIDRKK